MTPASNNRPSQMRLTNPDQQVSNYVDLETQHLHIKMTRHCHALKLVAAFSFRFGIAQPFLLGPESFLKKHFTLKKQKLVVFCTETE